MTRVTASLEPQTEGRDGTPEPGTEGQGTGGEPSVGGAGEMAGPSDGAGDDPSNGDPSNDDSAASDSVVVTLIRVQNPDSRSHYLNVYRELPDSGVIDRSQGVEFGGRAQASVFRDAIYVFDLDNTSVTRWTVGDDLSLSEGQTVSFANTGLATACAICNVFASPERAFIQNQWAGVIVSWNPTTMELLETADIPESALTRSGMDGEYLWPLPVGDRVVFSAGWYDYEGMRFHGSAAAAIIDSTRDAPELTVVEDERCGTTGGIQPFADEEGNVYLGGEWFYGWHQMGTPSLAPNPACMLRIRAGESRFDPDYYVDLLAATNARAVRSARGMGEGKVLLNIWPESAPGLSQEEREADPQAFWNATVMRYVVLELETLGTTPVDGIPPAGAGNNTPLALDGQTLVQVYEDGQAENTNGSTLYAVDPDGSVERLLSAGTGGDFALVGRLR